MLIHGPQLQEFDLIRGKASWILLGKESEQAKNDCKEHGTPMLSLVAGKTVGVAKNIKPTIVRMPCRYDHRGVKRGMQGADWIDGLSKINDRLDRSTPTVVLMAVFWTPAWFPGPDGMNNWYGFLWRHKELLDEMAKKGAILVTGTGNEGYNHVRGVPGTYGKPGLGSLYVPELIVVGGLAVDQTEKETELWSIWGNHEDEAGVPHVYAPGRNMIALEGNKALWIPPSNGLLGCSGTSCSAAMTAGLAAYYIRLAQLGLIKADTTPAAIKDLIIKTSWSRRDVSGAPRKGIWNSVDVVSPAKEWTPNPASVRLLSARKFHA